jgi:gliding motility-associated-like protein
LRKYYSKTIFLFFFLYIGHSAIAQFGWTKKANFPGTARYSDVSFTIGHYAFVGCGVTCSNAYLTDFWKYNSHTNTWTAIANYPGLGSLSGISFAIEGKGYVGLGWTSSYGANDLWSYDTITNAWTAMAAFPGAGRYSCSAFVIGHKAYVVGGSTSGPPYLEDVWVYDAHQNTWTEKSNWPGGLVEAYINFAIGNHGYVGDGWYPGCQEQMFEYDTTADSWTSIAIPPQPIGITETPDTWVIGSKGYVCTGGNCSATGLRDGWMYDTITKSWCEFSYIAAAKIDRGNAVAFTLDNMGYFCTGNDTNRNCLADLWEYTPTTKINVSDTTNPCIGPYVHFSDSTTYFGAAWNWSFPGGNPSTSTSENPVVYYAVSGTYTATLVLSTCGNNDTVSRTITVTAGSLGGLTLTGKNPICKGTPDTLIAAGGTGYTWSTGATTSSIIIPSTSSGTYSVSITNGVCIKDTSIAITVSTLTATISSPSSVCSGAMTILTASGGGTYLWSNGSTTSSISVIASSSADTYSATITNGGCVKDTSVTFTVNPLPTVSLSSPPTICHGDTTILNASGGISYTWSTGQTTSSISVNPAGNTTYTVGVNNGTCTKDTSLKILVNPLPSVSFSGNTNICKGNSTTLNAYGGGTYIWSTSATSSSITVTPTTDSTYSIIVTNNGCSKDTSIALTVNTLTVTITSPSSICAGDIATLNASGGGTYLWSNGSTTSSISVVASSSADTYSATITNGGCVKDTSVTFTVNPLPTVSLSSPPTICHGDTTILNASGGISYTWSTGQTTSSISVNPSGNATYTVGVNNGTCTKDTNIKVLVSPLPSVGFSGNTTICNGSSATLIASGGGTYTWSNSATSSSITVNPTTDSTYFITVTTNGCSKDTSIAVTVITLTTTITSPFSICSGDTATLHASGGGTYAWGTGSTASTVFVIPTSPTTTYSVLITNGVCVKDTSVTVTVNPLPFAGISGTSQICKGDSVILTASGGGTYVWNTGQSSASITVTPTSTFVYTVAVTNSFGCKADTTFKVKVISPAGAITGPSVVCYGDSITLVAIGGGTYLWSTGTTNNTIIVNPTKNTTYSVIINNICIDTVTRNISFDNPELNACCDTAITSPGTSVSLQASGMSSYYWVPSTGINCDSCPDPTVNPTVTTTYTVFGTDSAGCKLDKTITVDVSNCLITSIPNVFTPNGDGIDDQFVINAQYVSGYSISIYDRWGKEMYQSNNPDVYWNGKDENDNELVSSGVYYYIIKYVCNNKSYTKDGYMQVIR